MKVSQLIEKRQADWRELETLMGRLSRAIREQDSKLIRRFTVLYRNACADLALATSYQLPPDTTAYLHDLVARAHNRLYQSQKFEWQRWLTTLFVVTPQRIFCDPCVHLAFIIFWGLFAVSGWLAYEQTIWPDYVESVVGTDELENVRQMYSGAFDGGSLGGGSLATGFYIFNNAGIGLACFVSMLFLLPGFVVLAFNAVHLGAIFGYMFRPELGDAGVNFKMFVTAHGPFELTAIVLSAGAGMRIGHAWLFTRGLRRSDSLTLGAREALPVAMCAVVLFFLAAFIEAFISPVSTDLIPWWFKGFVAVSTSASLAAYFVLLGYPWNRLVRLGRRTRS